MIDDVYECVLNDCNVGQFKFTATGNFLVIGVKFEDEIVIFVTDKYKEINLYKENDVWKKIEYIGEED